MQCCVYISSSLYHSMGWSLIISIQICKGLLFHVDSISIMIVANSSKLSVDCLIVFKTMLHTLNKPFLVASPPRDLLNNKSPFDLLIGQIATNFFCSSNFYNSLEQCLKIFALSDMMTKGKPHCPQNRPERLTKRQ